MLAQRNVEEESFSTVRAAAAKPENSDLVFAWLKWRLRALGFTAQTVKQTRLQKQEVKHGAKLTWFASFV